MVKTYLRVEPAPKPFLAKLMASGQKLEVKSQKRVLRTIVVSKTRTSQTSHWSKRDARGKPRPMKLLPTDATADKAIAHRATAH